MPSFEPQPEHDLDYQRHQINNLSNRIRELLAKWRGFSIIADNLPQGTMLRYKYKKMAAECWQQIMELLNQSEHLRAEMEDLEDV